MTLKKLTIVNGIIQDKFIDDIPVKIQIVKPSGTKNVRTLIKMTNIVGLTNHNTANTSPTAGDEAHAKFLQNVENADKTYISVHLFVDHDSITQCVPLDEMCYHAGTRLGNRTTIGIEICENKEILKAEENAKKLNAALLLTYPTLQIFKHQDFSGKYCPRVILGANRWGKFVEDIYKYVKQATIPQPTTTPTPIPKERIVEAMSKYFKDVTQAWASDSIDSLYEKKIISGKPDGNFDPNGNATRAELAVVIDRAINYLLQELNK